MADYLAGLDPSLPTYVRLAAARIAELRNPAEVDRTLMRVPVTLRAMVETLYVSTCADRIVRTHPVNHAALVAEIPPALQQRVYTHIQRLGRLMKQGRG